MTSRTWIRAYTRELLSHLHAIAGADAQEVIREIEGHLHEMVDQAEERGEVIDAAAVLKGFGPPEALAAQYIAHLQQGAPPPAGFRVLRRGVTRGLYFSMGGLGFSFALALLFLAVAKMLHPEAVGVWSVSDGNSYVIAWLGAPLPQAEELLGWSLVPVALLLSLFIAEVTRGVLAVLRRGLIVGKG